MGIQDDDLICAIKDNRIDAAREAIARGADVNLVTNGAAPLDRAAARGYTDICRLLIDFGAQINKGKVRGGQRTPADQEMRWRHPDTCRFLISAGANVNQSDASGETALYCAARNGRVEIFKMLVDAGANTLAMNLRGETVAHVALTYNHPTLAMSLLRDGLDPFSVDKDGNTLLHNAASGGGLSVAEYLLDERCDLHAVNGDGYTPLHQAIAYGRVDMCKFLTGSGANPSFVPANPKVDYLTPVQYAVRHGMVDMVRYFVTECGEDPAQRTAAGRTLKQVAGKHADMKEALLSLKIEVSVVGAVALDSVALERSAKMLPGGMAPL